LLDHRMMVHPPDLERDYVFIVVPDTWTFLDRAMATSASSGPSLSTPSKRRSCGPLPFSEAKAMFTSPPKRTLHQPIPPQAAPAYASAPRPPPTTPPTRLGNPDIDHTPTKKPRLTQDSSSDMRPSDSTDSLQSRTASAVAQDDFEEAPPGTVTTSIRQPHPTTSDDTRTLDSIAAFPLDSSTRPHRTRHPSKKSQGL
ncbi:hypothetical protein B0T10DRAFT_380902, partial [Thelonectria olida]